MADVVVVGSLMIDLVSNAERLPKPGETLHGCKFQQNFGGKGANQCVAARRLGATAAMVGKVGDDQYGQQYLTELEKNDINTRFVQQIPRNNTGIASIWVDGKGQNSIIITANANDSFTSQDIMEAEKLIKNAKVVICQLEVPQEVSLAALQLAKKHKVRSIFNPAPAKLDLSKEFLNHLDIICPNETEAEFLCGFPVDTEESCNRALEFFLNQGAAVVVITLGERGAVFASQDYPKMRSIKSTSAKVVDSTGAGDAFIGALAYFMATQPDLDLAKIISNACKYATESVKTAGTQNSYPSRDRLSSDFL